MDHKTWMIIINPSAGGGRTALLWPRISNFFIKAGLQFECVFTTHKFHAVSLTVEAIHDGARNITVIGGDGTIHEVMNGIFFQKDVPTREITLGLIPIGTGNDLIHTYDIPADYMEAAKTLLKGRSVITDVGKVTFQDYGVERTRFFANVAGFGLDAAVIRHYERSIEENRSLFRRMKAGDFIDGEKVLRAKIDMTSPNMNMRDPVIYRIKKTSHPRTGDRWCI